MPRQKHSQTVRQKLRPRRAMTARENHRQYRKCCKKIQRAPPRPQAARSKLKPSIFAYALTMLQIGCRSSRLLSCLQANLHWLQTMEVEIWFADSSRAYLQNRIALQDCLGQISYGPQEIFSTTPLSPDA